MRQYGVGWRQAESSLEKAAGTVCDVTRALGSNSQMRRIARSSSSELDRLLVHSYQARASCEVIQLLAFEN